MGIQDLINRAKKIQEALKNGWRLAKQEKYAEAIAQFNKVLALYPKNIAALNNIGVCLAEQGKYAEAIAQYNKVLALDPRDIAALNNNGVCLSKQEKYAEAIAQFNKVLALDPENIKALANIGECLSKQEKYAEVIAQFNKVLALDPKNIAALNNIGVCLLKQEKYAEAIVQFKKVLALDPKNIASLNSTGYCLFQQKKYGEAIAQFNKVLALDPDDIAALANIGVCLSKQKKDAEAIAPFHKARALAPQNTELLLEICNAYMEDKQADQAKALLRKALTTVKGEGLHQIVKHLNLLEGRKGLDQAIYQEQKDLWQLLQSIQKIKSGLTGKQWLLFRGQESVAWGLQPTLQRQSASNRSQNEDKYLENFKLKLKFMGDATHPHDPKLGKYDLLALMQHYGIPTNFLDWTSDPLTALYFALSEGEDFTKTPVGDICVWVAIIDEAVKSIDMIDEENPTADKAVQFFIHNANENRIHAQKGYLSLTSPPKCLLELAQSDNHAGIKLQCLYIENDLLGKANRQAKQTLETLGKRPLDIYPDFVGLKHEIIGYSENIEKVHGMRFTESLSSEYLQKPAYKS